VAHADGLVLDSAVHDFGTVMSHETYEHTFRLRNAGKRPVTITDVSASCACTVAKEAKGTVKPGERREIEVSLDTKTYDGEISKTLTLHTDDAAHPRIALTLKARVLRQGMRLSPRRVSLGNVKRGDRVERAVQVMLLSQHRGIRVTKVVPSAKWLRTSLNLLRTVPPSDTDPRHGAAYVLTLKPKLKKAPAGHFLEFITVHTNSDRWPFEDVEVKGKVE